MSDDLRTLAQAVVDAWSALAGTHGIEYLCAQQAFDDASDALEEALECGHLADADSTARAILTALDAADAQGYARAIGHASDVAYGIAVSRHQHDIPSASTLHCVSDAIEKLARERLPAAAERD
jgi:hypothetical protein